MQQSCIITPLPLTLSIFSPPKYSNMSDEHQQPPLQTQQQLPRQTAGFDRLENFNFLLSRHDPGLAAVKNRHHSFDASLAPQFNNTVSMDYDQTEGMGGLSVSSYDSIEDDRSSLDLRGYPYHGKSDLL